MLLLLLGGDDQIQLLKIKLSLLLLSMVHCGKLAVSLTNTNLIAHRTWPHVFLALFSVFN